MQSFAASRFEEGMIIEAFQMLFELRREGLHVLTPIEAKWDFHQAFEAAKALAEPFVSSHNSALTLQIKKEHRKGRVLLDIYRNRQSQTIVAAYSVRGLAGAPVSMPLRWEELEGIESPK